MPSLRETILENEVKEAGEFAYQLFLEMVADGCTVPLAHMLVFQEAPLMKGSDKNFNEEMRRKMTNMFEKNVNKAVETAQKAGVNTNGKYYVGGLGRYNDPAAWVSSVDDVKEVCKRKNLNSTGLVEHKARQVEPQKRTRLAKDLVDRFVAKELQNPKTAESVRKKRLSLNTLREAVVEKHSRKTRGS